MHSLRRVRQRRGGLVLAGLLATGMLPSVAGADELKPFAASYAIRASGITAGNAQVQLEKLPDGRWSYQSSTTTTIWVRFLLPAKLDSRSVFRIQDNRVIPETFTAEDGTKDDDDDQNIVFDWAAGRVRGVAERKRVDLPLQPGLLDTLSVQVALMHELLAGRQPERFVLLDKERIKDYLYNTEGQERLQTEAGTWNTVIYRSSRPGSRNSTWFWCAPELGYLPLKVERREGKEVKWSMRLQTVQR
jgi:hypothetical protein